VDQARSVDYVIAGAIMADIETSVVISAQTDDLQSGMEAASNAVQVATDAMRAQLAGLGIAAQQAQSQINSATSQVGSSIGALQSQAAGLAGSVGDSLTPNSRTDGSNAGQRAGRPNPTASARMGAGSASLSVWRGELQEQLLAEQSFFGQSKTEELAFWQDKLALTESGSTARFAVERNIYELEKQLAVQAERDRLQEINADQKIADAKFANYKAAINDQAALGQISATEQVRQEQDLLDLKWSYDQAYYEKKLDAAQGDVRTQQKLIEEQELAYEKYVGQVQALDTKMAEANKRSWDDLVAPVERAIDTSVTGIILGTTTVQKALANLAQSIIAEFVNSAVKGVFGQIGNFLGAGLLGGGNQDFSGGVTGAGEEILGGGIAELGGGAASAGIFGSLFKGIGTLFGFEHGGIVPSAQGGWAVPSLGPGGVLAQLHSNEMVLPANISQGLQDLIATPAGANGGSGGTPVVVNFGVSAMDSQDVARFFRSNGGALVAAINNAMRNGSMLRTS
jgi:hypothetical protein